MENFIIICLLIIAVGLAIIPTIRHFKGHGGCCGGSSYKPKKKKLKRTFYLKPELQQPLGLGRIFSFARLQWTLWQSIFRQIKMEYVLQN